MFLVKLICKKCHYTMGNDLAEKNDTASVFISLFSFYIKTKVHFIE